MLKGISAVLFDYGGTLGNDEPGYAEGFTHLLTATGYATDLAKYRAASAAAEQNLPAAPRDMESYLVWRASYRRELLRHCGVPETDLPRMENVVAERLRYFTSLFSYAESHFVLRSLKWAGFTVGMISNISPVLPLVIKELGFEQYLDFAIASDTFGCEKPDSRIFEEGLRRAGVPADQAIYVGDSPEADVAGSSAVGIHPVLICRRYPLPVVAENVTVILNMTQLFDLLGIDPWGEASLQSQSLTR
jgi:HAD superfamily hydrolase (TIGR01549 family)